LGRQKLDPGVDLLPIPDDRLDERPGELACLRVALGLGEMSLEDRLRRPLTELGLEDRGQGETPPRPTRPESVSPRRHRRGR
jgi:hypothetical protein